MANAELKKYFSPKAAVIGAVAASLVAFPILLLDLYQILMPVRLVTPTVETSVTTAKVTQSILPPLLTGLVELEYQRKGDSGRSRPATSEETRIRQVGSRQINEIDRHRGEPGIDQFQTTRCS
jgi:hypothetical protein